MKNFEPELLYVECKSCGKPIIWPAGMTTNILKNAEIDMAIVDEYCVLYSHGCPLCTEGKTTFSTELVRNAPEGK